MAGFYGCLRGKNNDLSIMASGPSDVMTPQDSADATEECTGKKKSRFQTFKNFFAKKKRKESASPAGDSGLKSSQSSDNVNVSEPGVFIRSEKDKGSGSKINLGNKALSHDSVFVSDSPMSEGTEGLGASQDSIHGKVKSLQFQLKQTIGLGSPTLYVKKGDDAGTLSEDDGLPCSPPEYSTLHTVLGGVSHRSSGLMQRNSSLSLEGTDSDEDQMSYEAGSRSVSPLVSLPIDFSLPASPVGCLDNSAARHRLDVRQKACIKTRKPTTRVDGRSEGESIQEEGLGSLITSSVAEDEEDVECMQTGTPEEGEEQDERSDPEEDNEHGDKQEVSQTQDAPSPSIQNDSGSEECIHGQAEGPAPQLHTQTAHFTGSLDSLEPPTGDDDDLLLDSGCEAADGGSLLQEVLNSLKGPLTSGLVLETEEVQLEVRAESWVNERAAQPETPSLPLNPTPKQETSLPTEDPSCTTESHQEGEPYESEDLVVEHFLPKKEKEVAEETHPEYLTEEDQDMPLVDMEKEKKVSKEYKAEVEENNNETNQKEEEIDEEHERVWREEVDEDEEYERRGREEEEKVDQEMDDEGSKEEEPVSELPVHTAYLETEEEEDISPTSVDDDAQQVPDIDTDPETARESPELPAELADPQVTEPTCASPLESLQTSTTEPYHHPDQDQDEPSVTSHAAGPEPGPREPCGEQTTTEDHGKPFSGSEQCRPRFTIAPAWQRVATKDPTSLSPPPTPSGPAPGPVDTGDTAKGDSPSREEPLSPVVSEVPASPSQIQRTTIIPPIDTPPATPVAQEEGTPENLFGVRLRKTSLGMLRLGSESETPPASPAHSVFIEPQRASCADPQPNSRPALPRKPTELDCIVKPKRKPDLSVGRVPSGGSDSPSWISVARQKQRIFKENSLEETTEKKAPSEMEETKTSIPALTSHVLKDTTKLPGSSVKVLCSLESSKPTLVDNEGKRALAHPAPTSLGQDEPPWMALAKKKAKAWSEMPQIVQ
ncbi:uncharacterized protein KIAA1211-like isoform X2 [Esox lucius]|uniref:DUF4592 domain-containing protein n=1 Tax=Esox lucius TaxID=8010 RepID=A0A3P8Y9R0_ESOLU|nr:uncharacterized protein KIAA1211-like isoform X2 [Esox lucius]